MTHTISDIDRGTFEVMQWADREYHNAGAEGCACYDALFEIVQDPAAMLAVELALREFTEDELLLVVRCRQQAEGYLRHVELEARNGGQPETL